MQECLDGQFVVPKKPSTLGWWLGQVLFIDNGVYGVSIMRVQFPERGGGNMVCLKADSVVGFDTVVEAMEDLNRKERAS